MKPELNKLWNLHADGFSNEDIAERLGLTARQVKGRLRGLLKHGTCRGDTSKGVRERLAIEKDQDPFDYYGLTGGYAK